MRALWVFLPGLMLGCGSAPVPAHVPASASEAGSESTPNGADPAETAWAHRASASETTTAIALWTQRAEENPALLIRVAQGHHFFATVHATEHAQVIAHAEAGLAAADHALRIAAPELAESLATPGKLLDAATAQTTPALYWHARLQLLLATARGYGQLLLVDDQVTRALIACERALPDYDHFGAVVLLGERDAHPLDATRRDLASARQRLDRAIAAEPERLSHHVALAEHYAILARDRSLFERELTAVKEAAVSSTDAAEQALAQHRAGMLLDHVNERFE